MPTIPLLKTQLEFVKSNANKVFYLGGIGSGKSSAGGHFIVRMASQHINANGLLTANTYSQLANATIPAITRELDKCHIKYNLVLTGAQKRLEVAKTNVFLFSLEEYDNIRGIEAGWWLSDESAFSKQEAVQVCRGRLRDKRGPLFERHMSSPNSYNWAYDEFENYDGALQTDKKHLIRAKTKDNIFLPRGYYERLLEDYGGEDNPLAQQELMGRFVNLKAGAIYWGFNRNINVMPRAINKDYPLYVGQDFNIGNMASCLVQYIKDEIHVVGEICLDHFGADTDAIAYKLSVDYKDYRVIVIPDSTGKALKTSSRGRTDIEILKSYGLEVMPTRNPLIRDRQNTLNLHYKKNKLFIDPSCKNLIKETETLACRDKEGDKAHVSVALGYVVYRLSPLRDSSAGVSQQKAL